MSKIMEAWEQVLREAISQDYDEQQFALLQISYVLQRHNPQKKLESDAAEETLSRDLLRLALDESRQRDTVIYLAALVSKHTKQADSFLFAMSNAQAEILIEPLLGLLKELGKKLKTDAIFQALLALDGAIKNGGDAVVPALEKINILPVLAEWAKNKDDVIADKAEILTEKIETLLGKGQEKE
jgi:hypothetical protein